MKYRNNFTNLSKYNSNLEDTIRITSSTTALTSPFKRFDTNKNTITTKFYDASLLAQIISVLSKEFSFISFIYTLILNEFIVLYFDT